MNPISNFIRHWRKHGWKATAEKWKYNFAMQDTPEQLLKKEIMAYAGTIVGLILALVIITYKGIWYFSIVIFFSGLIAYFNFKQKLRQYQTLKDIKE